MDDPIRAIWRDEPDKEGTPPHQFAVEMLADAEGPRAFIAALRDAALAADARTGIPAGFIVAQAALETGWGRYVPRDLHTGRYSYNLFGLKAQAWHPYVQAWTWEYIDGRWLRGIARFRAYRSYNESIDDHARLLTSSRYQACLKATDAAAYAQCIHQSGYATDPQYAEKLITIMNRWGLLDLRAPRIPQPPACRVVVESGGQQVTAVEGQVINGRAWAPVRSVAEALGATVTWDEKTRTARIQGRG